VFRQTWAFVPPTLIARWLLDELEDDELWDRPFATSQDALSKLAAEARLDRAAGRAAERRNSTRTSFEVARDAAFLGGLLAAPRERPPPKPSVQEGSPSRSYLLRSREPGYRALGLLDDDEIAWFWSGTHAAYDRLLENL
jgi:hypothetical protein